MERERRGLFTPTNQAGRGKETGRTERKREKGRETDTVPFAWNAVGKVTMNRAR